MHDSLPCNDFRVSRHVSQDPSCIRCGAQHETILHCLRDCPSAKRIWDVLVFTAKQDFNSDDCYGWFKNHALGDNGQLFVLACWFVWMSRNAETFSDEKWHVWRVMNLIQSNYCAVVKAFGNNKPKRTPRMVAWQPPLTAWSS